ncbi:response regulator transcription factor [Olsenella sp. An290]|uniref:response regulator transcription factor n=1 Tax=Olsenella sp. An290 TaxID=1965625 RepID=UPI000B386981|nr:response regulator transcription factor [Olsenella sp. An290]OUO35130.1 DNA-binding response regulator [Olsenella sp. An290]
MARILAIDDERTILDALARVLSRDGHEVVRVADPTQVPGMDLTRFDLVLCDVMMPGLDGFELMRQIRPAFDGPILFLTARVTEEDAVTGYGLGADDYVRKPFGAAELRAKVAAHLRRERRPHAHALAFGDVRLDLGARELSVGGAPVPLSPTEYAICELLARRPGQVMSRAQIREAVLGWESDADETAISMQVSRARKKLAAAGADPIATVWGMGYKWQL